MKNIPGRENNKKSEVSARSIWGTVNSSIFWSKSILGGERKHKGLESGLGPGVSGNARSKMKKARVESRGEAQT